MRQLRVAVIGCGSIGRRHIGNLLALGCDVYGYDRDDAARARARVLFPSADISEWVRLDVDAIVVASPWDTHLDWVEQAIARKIPFFVEKPLGSLAQLPRWRELAAMDLPVNQVGYNWRFHEELEQLRLQAVSPWCGEWISLSDVTKWPGHSYGPPALECSHNLDLSIAWLEDLGGTATVEYAETHHDRMYVRMTNGKDHCITLTLWRTGPDGQRTFLVAGEGGTWTLSPSGGALERSYVEEMRDFLQSVRENKPSLCSLADGLRVLEVCQQVEQMTKPKATNTESVS